MSSAPAPSEPQDPSPPQDPKRRDVLSGISTVVMTGGLVCGYGAATAMGVRYLFPAHDRQRAWVFVARASDIAHGTSISFRAPSGERIAIARQGESLAVESYLALSSTCPHLGCQVQWQPAQDRFFCPCHNGVFRPDGMAIGGPPSEAGQSLPRFPLKLEAGLLYIEVPVETLSGGAKLAGSIVDDSGVVRGPGHDPCLAPQFDPGVSSREEKVS